jgi:hypothetical protein
MASQRPLLNVAGVTKEAATTDFVIHGMEINLSTTVITTANVAAVTLSTRRTILTGSAGLSLAITLPAASASMDGALMTLMVTNGRLTGTWTSSGASTTGIPNPGSNTPVTVIYNHANLAWYVT